MKLLYLSTPSFADCDFPLIKSFQEKGVDVTYLILLPCFSLRSTLVDIKKQIPRTEILLATEYKEFKAYESYMDMSRVYVANRTGKNALTISYWKNKWNLYRFLKANKFDIIHCDYIVSKEFGFMFRMAKKWVQTIHDPFPHTGEKSKAKSDSYNVTIANSDLLVLLNAKQHDKFCKYYSLPKGKVVVNRLGAYDNIKVFTDAKISPIGNNVLFFGRISPYKGIEYLCKAMIEVRKSIPDATLTIAGGGKMYFDIKPYQQLGYINVINRYVGMQELAALLQRAAISVCPYTDATQSGVIMTSYSLGKPVVATNVGGLGEMVEDGKTGLLVPPKDVSALAGAITALLSDTERLKYMSDYIINSYYTGEKSWSSIADKYIEYYKKIL